MITRETPFIKYRVHYVKKKREKKVDLQAEYFPWHGVIWIGVSEWVSESGRREGGHTVCLCCDCVSLQMLRQN